MENPSVIPAVYPQAAKSTYINSASLKAAPTKLLHTDALGNAPAHLLQKRVTVRCKSIDLPARSSDDYEVTVNEADVPSGISIHRLF